MLALQSQTRRRGNHSQQPEGARVVGLLIWEIADASAAPFSRGALRRYRQRPRSSCRVDRDEGACADQTAYVSLELARGLSIFNQDSGFEVCRQRTMGEVRRADECAAAVDHEQLGVEQSAWRAMRRRPVPASSAMKG